MGELVATGTLTGPPNWLVRGAFALVFSAIGLFMLLELVKWVYKEEIQRYREQRQRRKSARRG
jgi:hypothetical protein